MLYHSYSNALGPSKSHDQVGNGWGKSLRFPGVPKSTWQRACIEYPLMGWGEYSCQLWWLLIYYLPALNSLFALLVKMNLGLLNNFPFSAHMMLSLASRGHWRDTVDWKVFHPGSSMLSRRAPGAASPGPGSLSTEIVVSTWLLECTCSYYPALVIWTGQLL